MQRDIRLWQFAGFSLTSLAGTLLHFLYDWTNESLLIAPFSGVNESTWEHMKLLFFPLFIFALIQSRFFKDTPAFWHIKFRGIVTGLVLIPLLFYTYNGAFGKSPDWLNITLFFVADAAAFLTETRTFHKLHRQSRLSLGLLCVIGVLFVVFTFATPRLPLFQDPITRTYGIT